MKSILKLVFTIGLFLLFLTAGPWCFIWAVNTLVHSSGAVVLVGFNIPFNFWTWLAALIIGGLAVLPAARRS